MKKKEPSCVRNFDNVLRDLKLARQLAIQSKNLLALRALGSAVTDLGKASRCIRMKKEPKKSDKK